MGLGYTTIMYDAESLERGLGDVAACRYDGVEMGLPKVRAAGPENVAAWLDRYGLDCYCVMSDWMQSEEAVDRIVDGTAVASDLGAEFLGLLPPQRAEREPETLETWFERICSAASSSGLTPVVHHHGGTMVERPDEIRHWLDRLSGDLGLLWDTAHYYPYGDHYPAADLSDALDRFADDIAYVHVKDVDPPSGFADHRDALTRDDFHLDDVINYFRSFTDLGEGVLDFASVRSLLRDADYDGHVTIEIENRTEEPLVHAKQNLDYWTELDD